MGRLGTLSYTILVLDGAIEECLIGCLNIYGLYDILLYSYVDTKFQQTQLLDSTTVSMVKIEGMDVTTWITWLPIRYSQQDQESKVFILSDK